MIHTYRLLDATNDTCLTFNSISSAAAFLAIGVSKCRNAARTTRRKRTRHTTRHDTTTLRGHFALARTRQIKTKRRDTRSDAVSRSDFASQKQNLRCSGNTHSPCRVSTSTSTYAALPRLSAPFTVQHLPPPPPPPFFLLLSLLCRCCCSRRALRFHSRRDAAGRAISTARSRQKRSPSVKVAIVTHVCMGYTRARGYRALSHTLSLPRVTSPPTLPFSLD